MAYRTHLDLDWPDDPPPLGIVVATFVQCPGCLQNIPTGPQWIAHRPNCACVRCGRSLANSASTEIMAPELDWIAVTVHSDTCAHPGDLPL
jgi:hypothetical protein